MRLMKFAPMGVVLGCGMALAEPVQPVQVDTVEGARLYGEQCAACHGAALQGQADWRIADENGVRPAPPHDETGHTWHHGDGMLFAYTALGGEGFARARGISGFASGMPGFAQELSDQQIWDILAYIKSTWPEDIRAIQAERTANE